MNAIEIGYLGRVDMYRAIFGDGKPKSSGPPRDAKGQPLILTTKVFDTLFSGKRPKTRRAKVQ